MLRFPPVLTQGSFRAIGLVAVALLAGCASTKPVQVDPAQQAYEAAAQDPDVARYASVQLYEAKKDLDRSIALKKSDPAEAKHAAELAETRVKIARSAAATGKARAETQELFTQRDKVRLEARTAAAEKALADARTAKAAAGAANTRAETAEDRAKAADEARLLAESTASAAEKSAMDANAAAKAAQAALSDLQGKQTERGYVLTLGGDIMFDTGKSVVNSGAMQQLFRVVTFLRENPDRQILIEGHTDAVGSETSNQALSERRASAVGSFFTQNGISGSRVATRGYGESRPTVGNDTPAGRQQNRRVEIVILNPGETAAGAAAR